MEHQDLRYSRRLAHRIQPGTDRHDKHWFERRSHARRRWRRGNSRRRGSAWLTWRISTATLFAIARGGAEPGGIVRIKHWLARLLWQRGPERFGPGCWRARRRSHGGADGTRG